jgi:hypothetical protein
MLASLKLPVHFLARLGVHPCWVTQASSPASPAESSCHTQSTPVAAFHLTTAVSWPWVRGRAGVALVKVQRMSDSAERRRGRGHSSTRLLSHLASTDGAWSRLGSSAAGT